MAAITLRPTSGARNERVGVDWWLLVVMIVLIGVGLLAIYSTGYGESQIIFKKQFVNVGLGLIPMAIFTFIHPKMWCRLMPFIYGANLVALLAVLEFGKTTKGAERWLKLPGGLQLQPSEISKILIIITLATFFAMNREKIKELKVFVLSFVHVLVPVLFILKQPHLGASLLIMTVWMALCLVAGVPPKYLGAILGAFFAIVALVIFVPPVRNKVLLPYQRERVEGLLGAVKGKSDDQDKGFQNKMAQLAFGNGGLSGTGFLKGEQKSRIPEQHSDFIFSLIGEEFGLLGSLSVLGLFSLLFYRLWIGLVNASDYYYQLVMAGILTVFAFHTFVNIGMVLQLLPVVGLWCPFLSSGGTALYLCMSMVGLALNIRARERAVLF
jgi:rod shape determining protein RodA